MTDKKPNKIRSCDLGMRGYICVNLPSIITKSSLYYKMIWIFDDKGHIILCFIAMNCLKKMEKIIAQVKIKTLLVVHI